MLLEGRQKKNPLGAKVRWIRLFVTSSILPVERLLGPGGSHPMSSSELRADAMSSDVAAGAADEHLKVTGRAARVLARPTAPLLLARPRDRVLI